MNVKHLILAALLLTSSAAAQLTLPNVVRMDYDVLLGQNGVHATVYASIDATYHGTPVAAYVVSGDLFGIAGDVTLIRYGDALVGPLPLSALDKLDNSADVTVTSTVCLLLVDGTKVPVFVFGNGTLSEAVEEVQAYVIATFVQPKSVCK